MIDERPLQPRGDRARRLVAIGLGLCCILAAPGCSAQQSSSRCAVDADAIKAADQAYAAAWLTNDPARVMATLTDDALIMPSGIPAMKGAGEIRAFWWPEDSPATTVTTFDLVQQEAFGEGSFAFVRGSFVLEFQYDGRAFSGSGDYMSVLRCTPEGSWRISHRAWNDLPPPSD